jgi:hypothetical protein
MLRVLERLKSLFRPRGVEVEYEAQPDVGPGVVPAGPPTGQIPPVAPVDDPAADAKTGDNESA